MKSATVNAKGPSDPKKNPSTSQAADDLRELMIDGLKDIYWAEKALTKALPKMAKNATDKKLTTALTDHLAQTQTHVTRLENVFQLLNEKVKAKKCEAMEGLIKEGEEIVKHTRAGAVRDAGIISACQKVEHYEIASYGTLLSFSKILDEVKAGTLLEQTLIEEKKADALLSDVAESAINLEAAQKGQGTGKKTDPKANKAKTAKV